jgi:diacylglycerol kinase family enzyme
VNRTAAIAASYHLLQTAIRGDAAARDDIGYLRSKRLKVTTDPPQKVVLDGELLGTTPIDVECIPGGLTILVPMTEEIDASEKLVGLPNLTVEEKPESDSD